jgi:hypothetical protein
MGGPSWLAPLAALVDNPLPAEAPPAVAGLIGDHPSTYARSPRIWTPALAAMEIAASYLSLDVPVDRLGAFVRWMRETPACLGVNVTTPHKAQVMQYLDEVDDTASAIGAVNTIVRHPDGALAGTNTDAVGLLAEPFVGAARPMELTAQESQAAHHEEHPGPRNARHGEKGASEHQDEADDDAPGADGGL